MKFSELVDIDKLRVLCESFTAFTGMVTAIVDLDGNVLIAAGWQDICTRFHRVHPATRACCMESDTAIAGQLEKGERYNVYRCGNGLVDVAVPIIVDDEHVANFFTGQFFFKEPNREFFIRQAEKYGFDKTAYLEALDKVPIVSEANIRLMMEFLSNLSSLIGETALSKKQSEDANKLLQQEIIERRHAEDALREAEEKYRILVERSVVGVYTIQDERFIYVNPRFADMFGYSPEEMTDGRSVFEFVAPESLQLVRDNIRKRFSGEVKAAHYRIKALRKNSDVIDVELYGSITRIKRIPTIIGSALDITERVQAEHRKRTLEKQLDAQKRLFYRDTILSVTDGKLDIVEPPAIRTYLADAKLKIDITNPFDITSARHTVECYCREAGLEGDQLSWFMTGLGEAMTNAVKHGIRGRVYSGIKDGSIWAAVSDKGTGIDSLMLPRATLLKGFSTKPSLGLGYSIMLDVSDRILLKTGKHGTTVILIKYLRESKTTAYPDQLPDIWDRVLE